MSDRALVLLLAVDAAFLMAVAWFGLLGLLTWLFSRPTPADAVELPDDVDLEPEAAPDEPVPFCPVGEFTPADRRLLAAVGISPDAPLYDWRRDGL